MTRLQEMKLMAEASERNRLNEHALRIEAEQEIESLKKITNFSEAVACVFDHLKFTACNTSSKEWDDQLEELAEDVIELAPEYKRQWKEIAKIEKLRLEAERQVGELREQLALVLKDRARFPDRPDSIGLMIGSHVGSLENRAKAAEDSLRWRYAEISELRTKLDTAMGLLFDLCDTAYIESSEGADAYDAARSFIKDNSTEGKDHE